VDRETGHAYGRKTQITCSGTTWKPEKQSSWHPMFE